VVGEAIRHVFGGEIASFMEHAPAGTVLMRIRRLLDSQFTRLSSIEFDILQYLAIAREPVTFGVVASEHAPRGDRALVLEAV